MKRTWIQFVVRPRFWQYCLMTAIVAPVVFVSEQCFARITFFEGRWAVWWPINGIALGALLAIRRRHWPWVLAGFAIGISFSEGHQPLRVIALVAFCNTAEVLVPALVLPPFRGMDKWLAQPGLASRFIFVAIVAAPLASSLVAPFNSTPLPGESILLDMVRWAAGDMLGIAIFTPLFLSIISPEMWMLFRWPSLPRTIGLIGLMTAASWLIFCHSTLPVVFLLYPLILLIGTQLGLGGAAIAIGLLASIATPPTLHSLGPFGGADGNSLVRGVLVLQIFLILSLSMTLPISVARVRRLTIEARLKSALQTMEALAGMDGLTGVPNRRRFDTILPVEWARAQREQSPLALLMIDTDHFKAFNDNYGHLAGDACLRSIAKAIAEVPARRGDLVARYGGEEFVLLLPGTDADGACRIAELVRRTIYALALPHKLTQDERVTVSIGCASIIPSGGAVPVDLIAASDKALYRAKHNGRNRVQLALDVVSVAAGPVLLG